MRGQGSWGAWECGWGAEVRSEKGLWGERGKLGWGRASGLAPGKRQQASAFQGVRRAGTEGLVGALRAQGEL
jgi:hypothetical protein